MAVMQTLPFVQREIVPGNEELTKLLEWLHDSENSSVETDWWDNAKQDYAFYAGDQDSAEVKALLAEMNRPASVFNEIKPKIDMLVGMAAQNRFIPMVVPKSGEDAPMSELMSGVLHHFADKIKLPRKQLECFEHTVKAGRSLLYFYVDKTNPFRPYPQCRRISGYNYYLDPDRQEYDLEDARYLFIDKWMTEDEINVFYPRLDVNSLAQVPGSRELPSFFDEAKNKYRLVECWYRKWQWLYWIVNPFTGEQEALTLREYNQFAKAMRSGVLIPGADAPIQMEPPRPIRAIGSRIHYMIFTGDTVLESGMSPYKFNRFPAVEFGAYKNDNSNLWFSVVRTMLDPQKALNTMRRQLSHLLQTLPKGLLVHEVGTILNIEEYEERSADPAFHLPVQKGGLDKIKFEKQPQISPVYQTYDATMQGSMKQVSGIADEIMGFQKTSREAGVTVQQRMQQSMAVLYMLYQNYKDARFDANKILLQLTQQYVTWPEVIRITGQEGGQLAQINTQINPQLPGYNDINAAEYDLAVEETVETASTRLAIAQILTDLSHQNPNMIPPDIILEYANLPFTVRERIRAHFDMMMRIEQENKDADRAIEMMKIQASRDAADKQAESKSKGKEE